MDFERTSNNAIQEALNGDEARAAQDYKAMVGSMYSMIGANSVFALSHAGIEQLSGWF